jgi:hypothetical protein
LEIGIAGKKEAVQIFLNGLNSVSACKIATFGVTSRYATIAQDLQGNDFSIQRTKIKI